MFKHTEEVIVPARRNSHHKVEVFSSQSKSSHGVVLGFAIELPCIATWHHAGPLLKFSPEKPETLYFYSATNSKETFRVEVMFSGEKKGNTEQESAPNAH